MEKTAIYNGKKYRCTYAGKTKYGQKAKLEFFSDPSKSFWVDLEKVQFVAGAGNGKRAANGECMCGACEDLLSIGYRPGQRIRCKKCGGWAEAG